MKKIAIIDDEQIILDVYKKILQKKYEIVTAMDGQEGLELIKKEKPVLVLVDVKMPIMTGLEMIKNLQAENLFNMPIIITTNSSEDENISKAVELGVTEYILKVNTKPQQILEKVDSMLK